jgi:hypothetical protein
VLSQDAANMIHGTSKRRTQIKNVLSQDPNLHSSRNVLTGEHKKIVLSRDPNWHGSRNILWGPVIS